jgi:hypothetical protein
MFSFWAIWGALFVLLYMVLAFSHEIGNINRFYQDIHGLHHGATSLALSFFWKFTTL